MSVYGMYVACRMADAAGSVSDEELQKEQEEPEVVAVIVGRTTRPKRLVGLLPSGETVMIEQPAGEAHWLYVSHF